MENKTNIRVSCVYRAPGSNTEILKNIMEGMFAKSDQKVAFICGGISTDMLNPNEHVMTDEFTAAVDTMSLHPLITEPSRITSHSATLQIILRQIIWTTTQ